SRERFGHLAVIDPASRNQSALCRRYNDQADKVDYGLGADGPDSHGYAIADSRRPQAPSATLLRGAWTGDGQEQSLHRDVALRAPRAACAPCSALRKKRVTQSPTSSPPPMVGSIRGSIMKVGDPWMPFWRAYLACRVVTLSRSGISKAEVRARPL